ncbi:putative aminotransferase [Candidatus Burkholderia verschuerenii]|uniref:Putative aminotransferase n=1 Tax=Candidatus Burkholderia verschuerenii TaxID=242163 RepID=A0A0L0MCP6_9BURK|nr:aspartate aminotransferase family protein [Candidatus Burkholderia verschuerenii]KND59744.1 putative aminotransferase [Candidatus Burkholderia verschuerenii]
MNSTASMINGYDESNAANVEASTREMIAQRNALLGPCYKLFYENPVRFVRAEGVHLYDEQGRPYLDVYNNVPVVWHCHPRVVEAIARQASTLNTHTRYLTDEVLTYAKALLDTFPNELGHVMFTCTGSEANDLAMRIARFHTGGTGFIVSSYAYHGITQATAEISPSLGTHQPLGRDIRSVPAPDTYRQGSENVDERFAAGVEAAIANMQRHGIRFAGLIVDTGFSSDGLQLNPTGFLKQAVDVVHAAGGLFIADEVQPGFARLGESMWGFSRHGVVPDLVTMGKPMGNGLPIAAIVVKPELVREFGKSVRYFNTFGGNSVCIAAANAVLDVIRDEDLLTNSRQVGAYLRESLAQELEGIDCIGDVRGSGLFVGVEFVKDRASKLPDSGAALRVVNALREKRVLISASGAAANVLKIRPPLPFSKQNVDEFMEVFKEVLPEVR